MLTAMSDKPRTGIIDEPLEIDNLDPSRSTDRLGVADFANALSQFIKSTDTPMTIGVQGEWGSGKTSLLKSIVKILEGEKKNTEFECIWINTWENSLLKTPEETLMSIVNEITQQVSDLNPKNTYSEKVIKTGKKLLAGALRTAAAVTLGEGGQAVASELIPLQAENSIKKLRSDLVHFIEETILDEKTKDISNIKKIIFFIDDLDRIEPADAVKVLELLKNIFSLKYCVFVLAIDYQVVIKGLKQKFGEKTEENEREFRSFFDKLIQLPFTMPIQQYSVSDYVLSLLIDIGFINNEKDFDKEIINEILDNTIGSNPRAIKRLINNLSLISILNTIKQQNDQNKVGYDEKLLEFALVCCQVAYPKIYELIAFNPDIEEWDDDFAFNITQKKEEQDPIFQKQYNSAISQSDDFDEDWEKSLYRITFASSELRRFAPKISRFLSLLVDKKIKFNNDQLIKILSNTSATIVTSNDDKNFRKPEKRQQLNNYDEFLKSAQLFALEKGIDKNIIDERASFFDKVHKYLVSKHDNNNLFSLKFYRESIGYYTKINGKERRFSVSYPFRFRASGSLPANKTMRICFVKDPQKDFRLPNIKSMNAEHLRKFNPNHEKWFWCNQYDICLTEKGFDEQKIKIEEIFNRSMEIISNGEKQLKPVELSSLSAKEIEDLEIKSQDDYTYDL